MSAPAPPGADADADASRPRSGILTPTSDASLNCRHGEPAPSPSLSSQGKATAFVAMEGLLKDPVILKPHPPNLHAQPRVVQPLMLLPREHLPLSCLDLSNPQGELPSGRLLESHIKILDLESRMGAAPRTLIARNESRGTLYAIERHDNALYAACKLGSWTALESLASRATVVYEERVHPPSQPPRELPAPGTTTTPQMHREQKKKRVAIEAIQSLVRKRPRSQSTCTLDDTGKGETTSLQPGPDSLDPADPKPSKEPTPIVVPSPELPPEKQATSSGVEPEGGQQQTAASIFDSIRSHYFDALYKSKGSLAYFAKGPLSRARSTFHLDLESDLDINDLIDFLKGLVLTTVQIDKKHRESIPEVISRMKAVADSSDEGRKRRRRPKKMKLNKNGLYPLEDELIQQWWTANKPELKGDDSVGITMEQVKAHVSLLRTRETQLQMIAIMEILALEPLKPQEQPADAGLPALPGELVSQDRMGPPPPPRKRNKHNKHNLPVLLDVHADRLTIWQSMASDEQILLQDSQNPTPVADGRIQQKTSSEPLRDFCVDVIVPFYSARLPQLCDSLSRKLGGPTIVSPPKSKAKSKMHRRSSSRPDQRPGAAARRTAMNKVPQTLEHALSFEQKSRRSVSRGPSQIEDLMRATSASLPNIKREDSEPSGIKAPPKGDAASRQASRPSLSRSSSLAGMEDSKASRKAKLDAELRDAISNLRKPNREVVGKAMAEADQHRATAVVSAKKLRRGTRPSAAHTGIQVKATPANQRFRDVMGPKHDGPITAAPPPTDDLVPPSSIGPLVPSTVSRNSRTNIFEDGSSPAFGAVGRTPIRRSTESSFLRRPIAEEPAIPPSSPIMTRSVAPMGSPTVPASVVKPTGKPSTMLSRFGDPPDTPIKQPALPRRLDGDDGGKRGSIYERLGWDDDDLDDLL